MRVARVDDDERLAALRATGLLDTAAEAAFDRVTRLAARLLGTPVTAVSLIDGHRQFIKSAVGLGDVRETPLSHSLCRYVVETEAALVVDDARVHPLVRDNPAVTDHNVAAYLGVPIVTSNEQVLGALCAMDHAPRHWSPEDVGTLHELVALVVTEVELRLALNGIREQATVLHSVLESMGDGVVVMATNGDVTLYNAAAQRMLGARKHATGTWPGHLSLFESNGIRALPAGREPLGRATRGTVSLNVDLVVRSPQIDSGERHLSVDAHPVRSAAGGIVAGVAVFRDTTQTRAAQAELQASEERYRLLAENSSDLVRILTVDDGLIYCSSSSAHLLGYQPHEMLELPRQLLFRQDERPMLKAAFDRAVATGAGGHPILHRLRHKSGVERWFETSLQPIAGSEGVSRVHSTSRDVTERVVAQDALAERELRTRRLADAAFEGISISENGVIVDSNAAFASMFGYQPHEILGMRDVFVVEAERERVAHYVDSGDEGVYRTMGLRRDASSFPIEMRGATVPWGERVVRITATRDLTSRVASEQAMQLHGEVLGNMAEGVCLIRIDDGSVVYANLRFLEMFGYSQSEILGVSVTALHADELLLPGSGARAVLVSAESDRRARYEALSVRKNGTSFWTRATTSKMTHPDHGPVRVVVIEDITDRKREAKALARQTAFVDLLRRTATEANAALTAEEAVRTCLQRVCEHMGWPLGHALLRADDRAVPTLTGRDLWHAVEPDHYAALRAATAALCLTANEGLPGRVLATAKPQWGVDASGIAKPVDASGIAGALAGALRSGVALPVLVGPDVVAVLEFFSESEEPADEAVLAVLADVGVQLGWVFERERTRGALERHAAEVQALSLADELTGLRNRRGFMMLAAHQLRIASRVARGALLFFADLNGMKRINDTLGHDVGDLAIQATADLLRLSFRDADVIARLGGDEFVIFAPDAAPSAIPALRSRVASNVAAYNARAEQSFELSISLGAAIYDPQIPRSLEALLAEADEAMYEQKRARQRAQSKPSASGV